METQLDIHSVVGISRDSATTWRQKQIKAKFGNTRKRGQALGWFIQRKQREVRKVDDKKTDRWQRQVHPEESQVTSGQTNMMSCRRPLLYSLPTAHLHPPPLQQTQHRLTELCVGPKAKLPCRQSCLNVKNLKRRHLKSFHSFFYCVEQLLFICHHQRLTFCLYIYLFFLFILV